MSCSVERVIIILFFDQFLQVLETILISSACSQIVALTHGRRGSADVQERHVTRLNTRTSAVSMILQYFVMATLGLF